jgi:predicted ATPase
MLETTRAYALERLDEEGERDAAARHHAQYFRDLLQKNNLLLGTLPMATWLAPLECELDNLRAALAWAIGERHDLLIGVAIAVAQTPLLEAASRTYEGVRWCAL